MDDFDMSKFMNMSKDEMGEMMNKASKMINEGNIPNEVKQMLAGMSSGGNGNSANNSNNGSSSGDMSIDPEMLMKMKQVMDKMKGSGEDPRANLLSSLKPYLKDSRKDKVDQYIKMMNMSKVMEIFNGGDTKK